MLKHENLAKKFWVWGYHLDKVPGNVPFVNNKTFCSLETAARYLNLSSVVYMDPMHDLTFQTYEPAKIESLAGCDQIICALTNDRELMPDAARKVAELSKRFPSVKGAVIDDFLDYGGVTENYPVDYMKRIYDNLKSVNPELKLYVVRYLHQRQYELEPYVDYFDGINLWNWVATDSNVRSEYAPCCRNLKHDYKKTILPGVFLHNYGETYNTTEEPSALDLLERECKQIFPEVRNGAYDGCVFLQSGWFSSYSHRKQVQFLKDYLDWFIHTTSGNER